MDSEVPLGLDSAGQQSINVRSLRAGLWKVRVQWKAAGQEYFLRNRL